MADEEGFGQYRTKNKMKKRKKEAYQVARLKQINEIRKPAREKLRKEELKNRRKEVKAWKNRKGRNVRRITK
ncbi:hypothetical protein QE152_g40654 [Popillia japonica]|uniref:Uncharacterized protein n=1 Tax=Popillia japonica TaxID=7064 RepID=A0AAW1HFQ4_POPJA